MAWWIWLIIGFGIGIIEVSTFTFVLLWFSVAALVTAVLSVPIHSVWVQLLIFAVIGLVLFFATRPLARKWKRTKSYPDRTETMIGRTGVVITEAEPGAFATVRISGDLWSARCNEHLNIGDEVVVRVATATVVTVEIIRKEGI